MNCHKFLILLLISWTAACDGLLQIEDAGKTLKISGASDTDIAPDLFEQISVHKSIWLRSPSFVFQEDYSATDTLTLSQTPSGDTQITAQQIRGAKASSESRDEFCERLPYNQLPDLESPAPVRLDIRGSFSEQFIDDDNPIDITFSKFERTFPAIIGIALPVTPAIDEVVKLRFITATGVYLRNPCTDTTIDLTLQSEHLAVYLQKDISPQIEISIVTASDPQRVRQRFVYELIDISPDTRVLAADSERLAAAAAEQYPELSDWIESLRNKIRFDPLNPPQVAFTDSYILGFSENVAGEQLLATGPVERLECIERDGYDSCPSGISFAGGSMLWTPGSQSSRSYQLLFKLYDPAGYEPTEQEFLVKVKNENIPPLLTCGAETIVGKAGDVAPTDCLATDADQDDSLAVTISGSCLAADTKLSAAELIDYSVTLPAARNCDLLVTVTDGFAAVSKAIAVRPLTFQLTLNLPSLGGDLALIHFAAGFEPLATDEAEAFAYTVISGQSFEVDILRQPEGKFCVPSATAGTIYDNDLTINFVCNRAQPAHLAVGGDHSCVLYDNNWVKCWGKGNYGQLGQGDTSDIGSGGGISLNGTAPLQILSEDEMAAGLRITNIAAGGDHSCALISNGKIKCWGRADYGQLGYGDTVQVGSMTVTDIIAAGYVPVDPLLKITSISLGVEHSCAVLENKTARCWVTAI